MVDALSGKCDQPLMNNLGGVGNISWKLLELYFIHTCLWVDSIWKTSEIRVKHLN